MEKDDNAARVEKCSLRQYFKSLGPSRFPDGALSSEYRQSFDGAMELFTFFLLSLLFAKTGEHFTKTGKSLERNNDCYEGE
ncbi:MAG TPA: hypothetical protein VGK99_18280 [Acidobacteriota bacterium]